MKATEWFNEYGWLIKPITFLDAHAAYHQGRCDNDVAELREMLGFEVPREEAIVHLQSVGGWTRDELEKCSDDELAEKVLWMFCGDIVEDESDDEEPWKGCCLNLKG